MRAIGYCSLAAAIWMALAAAEGFRHGVADLCFPRALAADGGGEQDAAGAPSSKAGPSADGKGSPREGEEPRLSLNGIVKAQGQEGERAGVSAPPAPVEGLLSVPADIGQAPVLRHIAESGAKLLDLGVAHGLRGVLALKGDEFMLLQLSPDGEAVVAGLQTDLSVSRLLALVGGHVLELGTEHGLRGFFVRDGEQFQVFYGTPDGERLIPGVMWDWAGKNVTRVQVENVPGAVPAVVIGKESNAGPERLGAARGKALDLMQKTAFGLMGREGVPRLWMIADPLCAFSVRALREVWPLVEAGRVQLAVVPVSILDYETAGQSTPAALALLSRPPAEMAEAWFRGDVKGSGGPGAAERLKSNMEIAGAIGLKGTPLLVWRRADGSEGRSDGVPSDWNVVLASMGGAGG